MERNPFKVGDVIHGFAFGYFGRDSYKCRRVEVANSDYVVTRNLNNEIELLTEGLASVYETRDDRTYCGFECQSWLGEYDELDTDEEGLN